MGKKRFNILILLMLSSWIISCEDPTQIESTGSRDDYSEVSISGSYKAYIFEDNPIIATDNPYLEEVRLEDIISSHGQFITKNDDLYEKCKIKQYVTRSSTDSDSVSKCIRVYSRDLPSPKGTGLKKKSWSKDLGGDSFYQVNTFYHLNKTVKKFLDFMEFAHYKTHVRGEMTIPPAGNRDLVSTNSYWFQPPTNNAHPTLKVFANCDLEANAFFSSADLKICLGKDSNIPGFRMAQDPDVLYHELGHAFVKIMINQRNTVHIAGNNYSHPYKAELGTLSYDESGAINEGIADYFSYFMTNRTHIGKWGMGRFYNASRPMTESDKLHAPGISTRSDERLRYPKYLHYNPNDTSKNHEDIHVSGQIVTHFLVALTKGYRDRCSFKSIPRDKDKLSSGERKDLYSKYLTLMLVNETLAEVGDLFGLGSDYNSTASSHANLDSVNSFLWTHTVNPPNFRRFFQIFAKNAKHIISGDLCPEFSKNMHEQLLDDYGLLLFKNYADDGQSGDGQQDTTSFLTNNPFGGPELNISGNLTEVNVNNRRNSILVSKDLIDLPTQYDTRNTAYIFDDQVSISKYLAGLTFQGANVATSAGLAGYEYNNSNIKISPGEVVGISLNLVNNSNSTMSGVEILANDWDHMKLADVTTPSVGNIRPCMIDGWPIASQNGEVDENDPPVAGDCGYTTHDNSKFVADTMGDYPLDFSSPICMVQYRDENDTKWVSQGDYRTIEGLDLANHECLNYPAMSGDDFNPNECLVRALPGAAQATLGKIIPQKTWAETVKGDQNEAPVFKSSSVVLFEINKWVQPGTKFHCRFRARFSNCEDCYQKSNGEDYLMYEFAGAEPFKVIDFEFTVVD